VTRFRGLSNVLVGLFLCSAVSSFGQDVNRIKDLPFTATRTYVVEGVTSTYKIARASNGSTYVEQFFPAKLGKYIIIEDVPHRTSFFYRTDMKTYYVFDLQPGNFKTFTVQNLYQSQEQIQQRVRETHLGEPLGNKNILGLTIYGVRVPGNNGPSETWVSPGLGTIYSSKVPLNRGQVLEFTIGDIRYEEPDPHIFEIPAEYTRGILTPVTQAKGK
jgi:hypothetical protein